MNRTSYKPKEQFGCDYCGWLGPGGHICDEVRRAGVATIDDIGNFASRKLESEMLQNSKSQYGGRLPTS